MSPSFTHARARLLMLGALLLSATPVAAQVPEAARPSRDSASQCTGPVPHRGADGVADGEPVE